MLARSRCLRLAHVASNAGYPLIGGYRPLSFFAYSKYIPIS